MDTVSNCRGRKEKTISYQIKTRQFHIIKIISKIRDEKNRTSNRMLGRILRQSDWNGLILFSELTETLIHVRNNVYLLLFSNWLIMNIIVFAYFGRSCAEKDRRTTRILNPENMDCRSRGSASFNYSLGFSTRVHQTGWILAFSRTVRSAVRRELFCRYISVDAQESRSNYFI